MDHLIAESAEKLFARYTPDIVRTCASGGPDPVWRDIDESGFLDLMRAENAGGASLPLDALLPLALASGRHAVPAPIIETIFVRAACGGDAPEGAVLIAGHAAFENNSVIASGFMNDYLADWILCEVDKRAYLYATRDGALENNAWHFPKLAQNRIVKADLNWRAAGALAVSARMAGALMRLRDDTVHYAKQRTQFGRPLAQFQAIQQQISVLVQQVALAEAAVAFALQSNATHALGIDPFRVAAAKTCLGPAANLGSAIAHAVHGAIGMAEEFELHIFTRLLQRGRMLHGSDLYWARYLGAHIFTHPAPMLDHARALTAG